MRKGDEEEGGEAGMQCGPLDSGCGWTGGALLANYTVHDPALIVISYYSSLLGSVTFFF